METARIEIVRRLVERDGEIQTVITVETTDGNGEDLHLVDFLGLVEYAKAQWMSGMDFDDIEEDE